jgi:uncharacterized phage protein gp47/JayE
MFEDMTFERILARMLARVPNEYDKREGSIIYNALAPAAVELQNMYIELDVILNESFADTATRPYLIRRASERGVFVSEATKAIRRGEFNMDVPVGARFSLNKLNYVVLSKIEDGAFRLECETPGEVGNAESGALVPIEYIEGLTYARLTDVLIPGEDDEGTESLRQRYFDSMHGLAFGGNLADYKKKVGELQGVGAVKVYPVWNGGGTVRLAIIDSTYSPPSQELIDTVQTAIDPTQNSGTGVGLAPIGHVVTVTGVVPATVNVAVRLTYQSGWDWDAVLPYLIQAINSYFDELRREWADSSSLVVRISQIETRILDLSGVIDIADTTLGGVAANLALGVDEIPVLGTATEL